MSTGSLRERSQSKISLFKFSITDLWARSLFSSPGLCIRSLQEVSWQDLCTSSRKNISRQDLCKISVQNLYKRSVGKICEKVPIRRLLARSLCKLPKVFARSLYEISVEALQKSSLGKISVRDETSWQDLCNRQYKISIRGLCTRSL